MCKHRKPLLYSLLWLFLSLFVYNCHSQQTETGQHHKQENPTGRQHREKPSHRYDSELKAGRQSTKEIPAKVYDVLAYVRANGRAPEGYVGGRRFGNFEGHLPRQDLSGRRMQYQEWDVNPKIKGRNRGAERLVTSADGRAWYTRDHYNSFVEVK